MSIGRIVLAAALLGCASVETDGERGVAGSRPNIVLVLTDDQGWGDLSVHGNKNLATPHVDSLARDGALFENFYVCAVCAPTRAELSLAKASATKRPCCSSAKNSARAACAPRFS